jgi:hypothetical protein
MICHKRHTILDSAFRNYSIDEDAEKQKLPHGGAGAGAGSRPALKPQRAPRRDDVAMNVAAFGVLTIDDGRKHSFPIFNILYSSKVSLQSV